MVVEEQTIKKLLDQLERNLNKIERMEFTLIELLKDVDIQDLIDRRLHIAVEACIDIASHLAAALSLPGRDSAAEVFLLLGKHKIIPKALAHKFIEITGFRNILVHEYAEINHRLVFKHYKEDLDDLRDFAKAVLAFFEKNPHLMEPRG